MDYNLTTPAISQFIAKEEFPACIDAASIQTTWKQSQNWRMDDAAIIGVYSMSLKVDGLSKEIRPIATMDTNLLQRIQGVHAQVPEGVGNATATAQMHGIGG